MSAARSTTVHLPPVLHLQSRFFAATRKLWHRLGEFESSVLNEELEQVPILKPVYISGLARSGTTILTEMLNRHPELTSHRYSDFPNVWTPYWRNYLLQRTRRGKPEARVRAHQDRIEVTNDSPEAVEEVLWMYFFPHCHSKGMSCVLDHTVANPAFEAFYRSHIRKLLAVRNRPRYLAKGNYNVGRFLYLLKLFPDARFLVPYRNPVNHIASLMKQHKLFLQAHEEDTRVTLQLALAGHFEFGAERLAVHFGDDERNRAITDAWSGGREAEGWALYWAETYRFLADQNESHAGFRRASLFISYEDLCCRPGETIDRIAAHCDLDPGTFAEVRRYYCDHLSLPQYYRPDFNSEEIAVIRRICDPVAARLADLD